MDTSVTLGHAYRPRVIDSQVTESLSIAGAVLIEGPKGCGKTMTGMNAAASYALLDDPTTAELVQIAPEAVLDGVRPRLLDEWQLAPQLWNLLRRQVDAAPEKGSFLLTGSAVPADDATHHTGAGRILRLRQHTFAWWEHSGEPRTGGVSLADLFEGRLPNADLTAPLSYSEVIDRLLRPGFPALSDLKPSQGRRMLQAYIDEIARADAPRLVDLRHDPAVIRQLIAAIGRSASLEVSYTTLASDVRQVAPAITAETIASYVGVLERLFVVEKQLAWTPELRSRARLRTSAKLHLADPALAAAAIGASSERLQRDPNTVGLLFESAVFHDLQVLSGELGADIRHYRDSNGHEIDAVITLPDGRWAAVEAKLGGGQVPAGAQSLKTATEQLDYSVVPEPAFRLVISGTGLTYVMSEGTITCPLSALRP